MKPLCITITCAVFALIAPTAAASQPLSIAMHRAEVYWHAVPCAGTVRVVYSALLPEGEVAMSEWDAPGGHDVTFTEGTATNCAIHLLRGYWTRHIEEIVSWTELCQTVTHEVGHLLGHGYATDPRSIMNRTLTQLNVPANCGRALRPGAPEDGYARPALPASEWDS